MVLHSDEITSLVFHAGAHTTKLGYGGEDTPRAVVSSFCAYTQAKGYTFETSGMGKNVTEETTMRNAIDDGVVTDWETHDALLTHCFKDILRVDPTEHPLLMIESSHNPKESRDKMIEVAFEKYGCPAAYVAREGVLSAFAAGRPTALIVDVGYGACSATPVYDGYILKKAVLRYPVAGEFLTKQIALQFQDLKIKMTPRYQVLKKKLVEPGANPEPVLRKISPSPAYHEYAVNNLLDEYKETVCQVAEHKFNEASLATRPQKSYEFPDGYNANFGLPRYSIPEVLFDPSNHVIPDPRSEQSTDGFKGLAQMIIDSINMCDVDVRPLLYSNIVVVGGSTLFPYFPDRLNNELTSTASGYKIKVTAAGPTTERKFSSWIGGSILASLGSFQQMWIGKQEYEEHGKQLVDKRIPS